MKFADWWSFLKISELHPVIFRFRVVVCTTQQKIRTAPLTRTSGTSLVRTRREVRFSLRLMWAQHGLMPTSWAPYTGAPRFSIFPCPGSPCHPVACLLPSEHTPVFAHLSLWSTSLSKWSNHGSRLLTLSQTHTQAQAFTHARTHTCTHTINCGTKSSPGHRFFP